MPLTSSPFISSHELPGSKNMPLHGALQIGLGCRRRQCQGRVERIQLEIIAVRPGGGTGTSVIVAFPVVTPLLGAGRYPVLRDLPCLGRDVPSDPVHPGADRGVRIIHDQRQRSGAGRCGAEGQGRIHILAVAGIFRSYRCTFRKSRTGNRQFFHLAHLLAQSPCREDNSLHYEQYRQPLFHVHTFLFYYTTSASQTFPVSTQFTGTRSSGIIVRVATFGAALLDQNASIPVFPWVAITIRSVLVCSAAVIISVTGLPRSTTAVTITPAACNELRWRCRYCRASCSARSSSAAVAPGS